MTIRIMKWRRVMKKPMALVFIILLSSLFSGCAVTGGALTTAAYEGNTPVIKELLDKGGNVDERGGCGLWSVGGDFNATPLLCASLSGHMEAVKVLIDRGAAVNSAGTTIGQTPLSAAACGGHAGVVKLLIEKGADVDGAMAKLTKLGEGANKCLVFLSNYLEQQKPARLPAAAARIENAEADNARILPPPPPDGKEEFEAAKSANTFDAYDQFLKAFPSSGNRRPALQAMAALIGMQNGSYEDHRKFVVAYEDGLEFVPEKYRLVLTGPEGLRVHDIAEFRKKGVGNNIIAAKIRSGKGRYKDFSFDEIDQLKTMGIPEVVVEAMIESTSRATRDEEELQNKKKMADLLADIQQMQNKLVDLKTAKVSDAAMPVSAVQSQGPSVSDAVTNCASQVAALEACKYLPSLGAMVCRAAAKAQFPCE